MKNTIISLLIAVISLGVVSCSKEKSDVVIDENILVFDFGTGEFNEPFVWFLESRPNILVCSLKYPPFLWFVSDTVMLHKNLEINFNEECLRSSSHATLYLVDLLYRPLNQEITVFNDTSLLQDASFGVKADSLQQYTHLVLKISPLQGDTIAHGPILINGSEIDVINGDTIQRSQTSIAHWKYQQKIGWPIMIWLLWLLCVLIIIAIIVIILYYVGQGLYALFSSIKGGSPKSQDRPNGHESNNKNDKKQSEKNKQRKYYLQTSHPCDLYNIRVADWDGTGNVDDSVIFDADKVEWYNNRIEILRNDMIAFHKRTSSKFKCNQTYYWVTLDYSSHVKTLKIKSGEIKKGEDTSTHIYNYFRNKHQAEKLLQMIKDALNI